MLLRLISRSPAAPTLTLANGALATGYTILNTIDLGNASWQHALSGARGTQGARAVAGEPDNRVASIPVHIGPTGSVDSFNLKAALLAEMVDELRRFGGQILWQATGQTPRQYLEVVGGCGLTKEDWGRKGKQVDVGNNTIVAQCAPYMLGDPMDTVDTYATDSITSGDYTFDIANSGAGALSVAGGFLVPGATGLKRIRHTAKGYAYGDVEVTLKLRTGSTITGGIWGVTARADTAGLDTLLAAEIVAGTNVVRVSRYIATTQTTLASTAFTPVANTTYWVRLRCEGNIVSAEVFASAPTPSLTPTAAASAFALTTTDAGRLAIGHAGVRITAADTAERYGPLTILPFTYSAIVAPEQIRLGGQIPGDVPALADLTVTPQGGTATPIWGLAAWLERPLVVNLCTNGDFEGTNGTAGWSNSTVTGVMGAPTSLALGSTAARVKYGAQTLLITSQAVTDTGSAFRIERRFKKGRTYVALAWASSAAGTTSSRIKLGVSGDIATGTAAALTSTPKLYSVAWTPTTDQPFAYVAFGVNAATSTAIDLDGVVVVEVPTITLSAAQGSTSSQAFTVYSTPSEIPNLQPDGSLSAPFLAMIDQEIIRVTAVVNGAWTADRGAEGSTAATHAQDALVAILPPLRPHLEGKGAFPVYGIIEADAFTQVLSSAGAGTFTPDTVDATARGGTVMRWAPGTSGAQIATLVYFVDPHVLVPDDYTQGEIDIEVWLREAIFPTILSPRVTLSAQPESGSTFGPERFTREFGNVGKLLTNGTSSARARLHRLGTIPFIIDRSNPQRWRLKLTLQGTGGATPTWDLDFLKLVATRARLASPTGEANDTSNPAGAYPPFIPYDASWGGSSAMSKTMRSDMSATIAAPGGYSYPDAGMGDVIEVPDSDVDLVINESNLVPDDPTVDATVALSGYTTDAHLAVTPRFIFARAV